jgi:hypothetical protein
VAVCPAHWLSQAGLTFLGASGGGAREAPSESLTLNAGGGLWKVGVDGPWPGPQSRRGTSTPLAACCCVQNTGRAATTCKRKGVTGAGGGDQSQAGAHRRRPARVQGKGGRAGTGGRETTGGWRNGMRQ